jgi:hypothetical protein
VNAVNFPGKRQPTVGLDIYVAKLNIRYEERIAQYCCPQGNDEKGWLGFLLLSSLFFTILVGQKWHVVDQLLSFLKAFM